MFLRLPFRESNLDFFLPVIATVGKFIAQLMVFFQKYKGTFIWSNFFSWLVVASTSWREITGGLNEEYLHGREWYCEHFRLQQNINNQNGIL